MTKESKIEFLKRQISAIESGPSSFYGSDFESINQEGANLEIESFDSTCPKALDSRVSDEASRAFKKIIDLVNVSDRSEKTLRERLSRNGYSDSAIDEAVERARTYGFVNDARFAEVLIRSRISQNKGSAGIERELIGHGIDPTMIEGWPDAFSADYESEFDRALHLLEARPPHSKNLRDGAYRKLAHRGFPASVASSAARTWAESIDSK